MFLGLQVLLGLEQVERMKGNRDLTKPTLEDVLREEMTARTRTSLGFGLNGRQTENIELRQKKSQLEAKVWAVR